MKKNMFLHPTSVDVLNRLYISELNPDQKNIENKRNYPILLVKYNKNLLNGGLK